MKKWICIPGLVCVFFLLACQKEEEPIAPVAQGVGQTLDSAVEKLSQFDRNLLFVLAANLSQFSPITTY